jgi:hypothetical protein
MSRKSTSAKANLSLPNFAAHELIKIPPGVAANLEQRVLSFVAIAMLYGAACYRQSASS